MPPKRWLNFSTASSVHETLGAGPERVRLGSHVNDDERVLVAVFPLVSAVGGQGGTRQELVPRVCVLEDHRVVIRVNVFPHCWIRLPQG